MNSDFQVPKKENTAAKQSETPMAETAEAKSAEKNKGKYKLLLWLNLLWVIPLVVFGILKCFSSFEIEGTTLKKYKGSSVKAEIPKGVTVIGGDAFRDCRFLTSVVIPESVTRIEWCVFSGCSSLTSVVIPEGVTKIGDGAFSGCGSLTSLVIPDSVKEIGGNAFGGTALKEWSISSTHPHFKSDGAGV